jgi:hypothetical protein
MEVSARHPDGRSKEVLDFRDGYRERTARNRTDSDDKRFQDLGIVHRAKDREISGVSPPVQIQHLVHEQRSSIYPYRPSRYPQSYAESKPAYIHSPPAAIEYMVGYEDQVELETFFPPCPDRANYAESFSGANFASVRRCLGLR